MIVYGHVIICFCEEIHGDNVIISNLDVVFVRTIGTDSKIEELFRRAL